MKKVILGIALFIQFSHGMEEVPTNISTTGTTVMVSSRFLKESEARFRTNLESVLKSVTEGSITPENAIVSLRGDHRKSLELLSSCLNQKYLEQMEKQEVAQEERVRRIIAEKEDKIQVLGSELDTLRSLAATSENLRVFDQELEAARIKVIKAIQDALSPVKTPPLVTPPQVDWTSKRFSEQLDEIKKEVQETRKSLEEAFEGTQKQYADSISVLTFNLQEKYDWILEGVTGQYNEKIVHLEDAFEQEKALMQRMIDEVTAINLKLEKEKELADIIHGVYLSNPSDKFLFSRSFIGDNVQEITAISDLSQRRARVEDLYNKFKLFSSIYGREDLGVKATLADLSAVKNWLDKTNIDVVLMRYGHFEFPQEIAPRESRSHAYHDVGFNGQIISKPLFEAKARLQSEIDGERLNGHDIIFVQRQLNSIFQKYPEANTSVHLKWWHKWWNNGETNIIEWSKNGISIGSTWQEHGGGWWGETHGRIGEFRGRDWGHHDTSAVQKWNGICAPERDSDLSATVNAIKRRAMLLFDFETNPESELQKFYKEAGIVPTLTLPFPSMEIDSLIKQCNDFIKRSIS